MPVSGQNSLPKNREKTRERMILKKKRNPGGALPLRLGTPTANEGMNKKCKGVPLIRPQDG
jgi:hypothetical protein